MVGSAQASIQYRTAPPNLYVGLSDSDPIDVVWDVDDNGTPDFRLMTSTIPLVISAIKLQMGAYYQISNSNAFMIGSGKQFFNVVDGKPVGTATMTAQVIDYFGSPFTYHGAWPTASSLSGRDIFTHKQILASFTANYSNALLSNFNGRLINDKTIHFKLGFRFIGSDSQTHYGWANMTMDASFHATTLSVDNWAYEDEPNTAIIVGQIPEPGAVAGGLGALALGAAGLRRWRKRKACKVD